MKLNPFKNNNPMTWQDAAKISLILTSATFFTVFLPTSLSEALVRGPAEFAFSCMRFYVGSFLAQFITLAGLAKYVTKEKEKTPV